MRSYVTATSCRRDLVLNYFGEYLLNFVFLYIFSFLFRHDGIPLLGRVSLVMVHVITASETLPIPLQPTADKCNLTSTNVFL